MDGDNRTEAIIFDFDGILFDTENYYRQLNKDFCHYLGVNITEEELDDLLGISIEEYHQFLLNKTREAKETCNSIQDALSKRKAFENTIPKMNYEELLFPGVEATLGELKRRGYRLAVASSASYQEISEAFFAIGIYDLFDVIISGDDVTESEPSPQIYIEALKQLNIPATKAIAIEDSSRGIVAAQEAGVFTIARKEKRFGHKDEQKDADKIINTIGELLRVL